MLEELNFIAKITEVVISERSIREDVLTFIKNASKPNNTLSLEARQKIRNVCLCKMDTICNLFKRANKHLAALWEVELLRECDERGEFPF